MVDGLRADARFAFRTMARNPVFTVVIIMTLAIGIGANTAIFSVLHKGLFEALPYQDPQRLVVGRTTFDSRINPYGSAYDYYDYREQSDVFESFAAITGFSAEATITGGKTPERVPLAIVSFDLFPTLGVSPAVGRPFLAAEGVPGGPNVVMISHAYWQRHFGGADDVTGRSLVVNGVSQTIVGVMPRGFHFLWDVDVWTPMRRDGPFATARRFHNWLMVGRLKPGVSLEQAQRQVDTISARLAEQYPDSNANKALRLDVLQKALVEDDAPRVLLLMAAVAVVLLITCGNVAGLLLARGSARRTEVAVRASLGASRRRLVQQLLTESVILALAGGAAGIVFAGWLLRVVPSLVRLDLLGVTEVGFSAPVLAFAVAVTLLTGVLFGAAPALHAASTVPSGALSGGLRTTGARGGTRLRSAMVVAQVALSLMLLVCSGLLVKSFVRLIDTNPGFNADNLLTAEIQLPRSDYPDAARIVAFFRTLRDEVRAIPGVADVAVISQLPLRNPGNNIYVWAADHPPARPADRGVSFTRQVMPGYFEAMGIPLLAGRGIVETDVKNAPQVLVINKRMADTLFPGEAALGRRVMVDMGGQQPEAFEIVGVAGDARISSIDAAPRMAMYSSFYQFTGSTMRLAIRTAVEPATIVSALRDRVWALDRNIPVEDVRSMRAIVAESVAPRRVIAATLGVFAGFALLLAAIGLYGVLAYWVVQRTHEIGVRVALGAKQTSIVWLVAAKGLSLVGIGLALGVVGAYLGTQWVQQQLYEVPATDPAVYAATSALFVAVALVACLLPAWRAVRVDPVVAFRVE